MKQRDYEQRNLAKGLCVCCPRKRAKHSKRHCPTHLKLAVLKFQRHMAKKKKQFGKAKE